MRYVRTLRLWFDISCMICLLECGCEFGMGETKVYFSGRLSRNGLPAYCYTSDSPPGHQIVSCKINISLGIHFKRTVSRISVF
jgi:hypothetical protein